MVHTDDNGFKSVAYSRLMPVVVEALKEQSAQHERAVRGLREENARLAADVAQLRGEGRERAADLAELRAELAELRAAVLGGPRAAVAAPQPEETEPMGLASQ